MNKFLIFALFSIGTIFFMSCSDDDPSNPVIEITSPNGGTEYAQGATITIQGTVTDDVELSFVGITNTDLGLNEMLSDIGTSNNITFEFSFTPAIPTTAQEYEFVITARDSDNNSVEEKIKLKILE